MTVVVLWGKADCCLCDEVREVLERVRVDHPFELVERDIDTDEAAHRAYFERIPVVVVDGEEVSELQVDERALRAWLSRRRAGPIEAGSGDRGGSDDLESGR